MLEGCKTAKERWGGVNDLIDRWLHERQELLVQYYGLAQEIKEDPHSVDTAHIQAFCETLVDYLSAGHFEVYEQLAKEAEAFADNAGIALLEQLYPKLTAITEAALEFNDRYDREHCAQSRMELPERLSQLGEQLADRFNYEDQLIEALHNAHKEQLA